MKTKNLFWWRLWLLLLIFLYRIVKIILEILLLIVFIILLIPNIISEKQFKKTQKIINPKNSSDVSVKQTKG